MIKSQQISCTLWSFSVKLNLGFYEIFFSNIYKKHGLLILKWKFTFVSDSFLITIHVFSNLLNFYDQILFTRKYKHHKSLFWKWELYQDILCLMLKKLDPRTYNLAVFNIMVSVSASSKLPLSSACFQNDAFWRILKSVL